MSKPVEVRVRTTNDWFGRFAAKASGWLGSKWAFAGAGFVILVWAVLGPDLSFFRYLATGDQYRDDHRYFPDGLLDPEHAKPRCPRNQFEAE